MTGLLVIGTVAVLAFVLVLLGAPGLFRPLVTYKIYFDNAAGIKIGAPVMATPGPGPSVCTENLNPDVMVMKSAKDRV